MKEAHERSGPQYADRETVAVLASKIAEPNAELMRRLARESREAMSQTRTLIREAFSPPDEPRSVDLEVKAPYDPLDPIGDDGLTGAERAELAARAERDHSRTPRDGV